MIHPKLTKKALEGLLDMYDVKVVKKESGFYIYSYDDFLSGTFFSDLVPICNVYGYDFYVASKENGTFYIELF